MRARKLRLSALVPVRGVVGGAILVLGIVLVTVVALMLGEVIFSPVEVYQALTGNGSGSAELFVVKWRLPRAVAAAVFGAMLGLAGALFQVVTRNPLGSPDIIGFTAGASAGGVFMIAFVSSSYLAVTGGALAGGLVVALAVLVFSRGGGLSGFRLVIVGITMSATLNSLQTWLVLTANLDVALVAAVWGAGSLNGTSWGYTGPAMAAGALLMIVICVWLSRPVGLLELGEDTSAALGSAPARTRLLAIVAGVALVAIATAATGPIAFVALAAPHVGRRVTGASGSALVASTSPRC